MRTQEIQGMEAHVHQPPPQFSGQEAGLAVLSLAVLSGLLTCCVKKSLSMPWVLVLMHHSTDN